MTRQSSHHSDSVECTSELALTLRFLQTVQELDVLYMYTVQRSSQVPVELKVLIGRSCELFSRGERHPVKFKFTNTLVFKGLVDTATLQWCRMKPFAHRAR